MSKPNPTENGKREWDPEREEGEVSCPACGRAEVSGFAWVHDHEYGLERKTAFSTCRTCQSVFQTPMPKLSELASFYPENYHSLIASGLLQNLRHDLRLRRLSTYINGSGTLLDFGCGNGAFILRAGHHWPSVRLFGFEIADECRVEKTLQGRAIIIRGSIENLLSILNDCDVITMNHVIEHLPAPLDVLCALREKLVKSGVLEGQTPCAGSLEHRVFRESWSGYHAPRHTVVFSEPGLRALMERSGFIDIRIRGAFNPASIAVSLASVVQGNRPGIIQRKGLSWLGLLGLSSLLSPFDLLSNRPGIMDFSCRRE